MNNDVVCRIYTLVILIYNNNRQIFFKIMSALNYIICLQVPQYYWLNVYLPTGINNVVKCT